MLDQTFVNESLSHTTTRQEDLIPTFADFLDATDEWKNAEPQSAARSLEMVDDYYVDDEAAQWILDDLFNALDEIAPDGTYFGSHPGDGSDYGFWQFEEE